METVFTFTFGRAGSSKFKVSKSVVENGISNSSLLTSINSGSVLIDDGSSKINGSNRVGKLKIVVRLSPPKKLFDDL